MSESEVLALAGMFKEISESVWKIALVKVYATSLQFVVWSIIFAAVGIVLGYVAIRYAAHHKANQYMGDSGAIAWVVGAFSFLVFIGAGGFITGSIARMAAPEWYALQEIIMHLR